MGCKGRLTWFTWLTADERRWRAEKAGGEGGQGQHRGRAREKKASCTPPERRNLDRDLTASEFFPVMVDDILRWFKLLGGAVSSGLQPGPRHEPHHQSSSFHIPNTEEVLKTSFLN